MLTLSKVAVTGGLSCGKSSVCRIFKELGTYVVSADDIVHKLLSPNTNPGQQVIKLLGDAIIVNTQIDRSLIAKKVFNNPALLLSLEKILHPAVLNEIEKNYQETKNLQTASLFVAEIPLLFEASTADNFDFVIHVQCDQEVCRKRFKESTRYDDEEYDRRMARQLSPEEKARRANYIIDNNGSLQETRRSVIKVYNKLISNRRQS